MTMLVQGVVLNNSSGVKKPGRVTVQRSFIVINKPFAHAGGVLLKTIEELFKPLDLVLKNIGSLYISEKLFGAGISLTVRLVQESSIGLQNRGCIRVI